MKLRKTKAVSPLDEFIKGNIGKTALALWYFLRSEADENNEVGSYSTKELISLTHSCPRSFYKATDQLVAIGAIKVLNVYEFPCIYSPDGTPEVKKVPVGQFKRSDFKGWYQRNNVYQLIGG